jgi:hypothetical protein
MHRVFLLVTQHFIANQSGEYLGVSSPLPVVRRKKSIIILLQESQRNKERLILNNKTTPSN